MQLDLFNLDTPWTLQGNYLGKVDITLIEKKTETGTCTHVARYFDTPSPCKACLPIPRCSTWSTFTTKNYQMYTNSHRWSVLVVYLHLVGFVVNVIITHIYVYPMQRMHEIHYTSLLT